MNIFIIRPRWKPSETFSDFGLEIYRATIKMFFRRLEFHSKVVSFKMRREQGGPSMGWCEVKWGRAERAYYKENKARNNKTSFRSDSKLKRSGLLIMFCFRLAFLLFLCCLRNASRRIPSCSSSSSSSKRQLSVHWTTKSSESINRVLIGYCRWYMLRVEGLRWSNLPRVTCGATAGYIWGIHSVYIGYRWGIFEIKYLGYRWGWFQIKENQLK